MSTDSGLPNPSTEALAEARRWVLRLRSGEATKLDLEALARWRAESPEHRSALAAVSTQWDVLRQAAQNVAAKQWQAGQRRDIAPAGRPGRRAFLGGALAASVGGVAYLAARPPLDLWPSISELAADYHTKPGQRRQLAFAENVSVEMNTRTSLVVTGAATDARRVEVVAGQIAVTAGLGQPVPSEPFVVVAGPGQARAARASFDLRYEAGTVSVTCFDGEVQVECADRQVLLGAQQRIAYGQGGLGDIASLDDRSVRAWRQGLLVFENEPLAKVIPEINRYRAGKIILWNDRIGRLPLEATFRLDRIEEVVPKIAHLFDLKVRTLPGGVVLLS